MDACGRACRERKLGERCIALPPLDYYHRQGLCRSVPAHSYEWTSVLIETMI